MKKLHWFTIEYLDRNGDKQTVLDCAYGKTIGESRKILKQDFMGRKIGAKKVINIKFTKG